MPRDTLRDVKMLRRELVRVAPSTEAPATDSRVRSFVASNETVDSYNSVIKASGWQLDRYNKNSVVLFGHASRELPIGKGSARIEGDALICDIEFFSAEENPVAEQALRIVDRGVMGVSVGFEPLESEYNESRETGDEWMDLIYPPLDYTRCELLEVSVVTIPANPDALPIGRDVRRRFLERSAAKAAPKIDELKALIKRVAAEETRAAVAKRTGRTSRS